MSNFNRLLSKFAVEWIIKIPTHLAYVATLPCSTRQFLHISDSKNANESSKLKQNNLKFTLGLENRQLTALHRWHWHQCMHSSC